MKPAEIAAELAESPEARIILDVALSHADRVILALDHGVHSVWDDVRGMWSFNQGVPEEVAMAYIHETDKPAPAKKDAKA